MVFFVFGALASLTGMWIFDKDFMTLTLSASDFDNQETLAIAKYLQIISQVGLFIIPPLLFARLAGGRITSYLRLNKQVGLLTAVLCLLVLLSSLPMVQWLIEINQSVKFPSWLSSAETWMKQAEANAERLTEAFLATNTLTGFGVNLLMIAVLPAIGEELVFRGVLQRLFTEWFRNHHAGIFASAVLFSALHFQFYGFLPRTALGLIFGYLFAVTGSLWMPIVVHFINNALAVVVAFLFRREIIHHDYSELGKVANFWWMLASVVLLMLLFFSINQHLKLRIPPHSESK